MQSTLLLLALLVLMLQSTSSLLCDGNRFYYYSSYMLDRQKDLNETFGEINSSILVNQVFYQDTPYRSYRVFNFKPTFNYQQSKQTSAFKGNNVLRLGNGTVRIDYTFEWEKTQLGSSFYGRGAGYVNSDEMIYEKTLFTNKSHQLQWFLSDSHNVTISKGLTIPIFEPPRDKDFIVINKMLNNLPESQTTVKINLLKGINAKFKDILADKVLHDKTINFNKKIEYEYSSYRGYFPLSFTRTLVNSTLSEKGLYLLFSQVLDPDEEFECGQMVPFEPLDSSYGGKQEFISNSLLKSTLKYALRRGEIDVKLSQQFWQSRAFQFYMGDIHQVMPKSTLNISTLEEVIGKCTAKDDPVFNFGPKARASYEVKVNFECSFNYTLTNKLINIDIVVTYEVVVIINAKTIDFTLNAISGVPSFVERPPYIVEFLQLAQFMVSQTLVLAKGGPVLGTGFEAQLRKAPNVMVKDKYLFLYDLGSK